MKQFIRYLNMENPMFKKSFNLIGLFQQQIMESEEFVLILRVQEPNH